MNILLRTIFLLMLSATSAVFAGEVKILTADFKHTGDQTWNVSVTLKHADSSWDHYADDWRIVDTGGKIIADRVLAHPHIDEQPFTRSQGQIRLPTSDMIYIEAHDKRHGWAPQRLPVDMSQHKTSAFRVTVDK